MAILKLTQASIIIDAALAEGRQMHFAPLTVHCVRNTDLEPTPTYQIISKRP